MNIFLSLLFVAFLMVFLTTRMYRSFCVGLGVYVGLWARFNMGWDAWIAAGLLIVTILLMRYIFDEKGLI